MLSVWRRNTEEGEGFSGEREKKALRERIPQGPEILFLFFSAVSSQGKR